MIVLLLVVLGLLALIFWARAAWSAIAIVIMSRPGQRVNNYFRLGRWKFTELEIALGQAAVPHLRRYKSALLAFLAVILCMAIVAGLLTVERLN